MKNEQIRKATSLLFTPGQVVELRVPKCGNYGTISGYYDDHDALAGAIAELSGTKLGIVIVPAVYFTLNPVSNEAATAVTNSWTPNCRQTTKDKDIARRRWLLVDIDPIRPANLSATDSEKQEAKEIAVLVDEYLRSRGWPDPVLADSGNGFHLLWRVDLPNDPESTELIKSCLAALAEKFDTAGATIDRSVFNAARIVKCYGSKSCKGPDSEDRPHRLSGILSAPERPIPAARVLLEELAAECTLNENVEPRNAGREISVSSESVEQFLDVSKVTHGVRVEYEAGFKWVLRRCPWEDQHTSGKSAGETAVFWFPDKLVFKCFHSHCTDRGWKDFRRKLEKQNRRKHRFLPASPDSLPATVGDSLSATPNSVEAVRSRIQELLYASRRDRPDLPPVKQAPSLITEIIWADLNKRGSFFKDDQDWRAYLNLPRSESPDVFFPTVIPVDDNTWVHSLLDRYYGLHAADSLSSRVIRQLGIRTLSERPSVPLHELGHYNFKENELYVCIGDQVIAVHRDGFGIVENGHKGYYFVPNRFATALDANKLVRLATEMMSDGYGMKLDDSPLTRYLFANTPFDPHWPVSPEQAKQLILCGFLSLPFGDFFPEKPVYYLTGGEDTGKTQTLRKMGLLLYGSKYDVTSMGDDPRDFTTALVTKYMLLIDDVATEGDKAKAKANAKRLTQAATNGKVFQRRFYTNADPIELDFEAWPWISGLSVFDRAPDFLSRLINLSFRGRIAGERQGPGEVRRQLEDNRLTLLAEYLVRLQAIVRADGNESLRGKKYHIKFRISDWATFLARCADTEGWLDQYRDLFASLQGVRLMEVSKDPLLIALKLWLINPENVGRKVEIGILYKELRACVQSFYSKWRPDVEVPCLNGSNASPSYFGSHLTSLAKTILESEFGFSEVPGGWDSNRNRVRLVVFNPSEDQLKAIRSWHSAWTGNYRTKIFDYDAEDAA